MLDSKCNEMVKEIKEAMAKINDLRTFMRVELLAEAQKQINSAMQLVVGDLEKQMEELRMKGSSLENKYNQMVKEVTTKINELSTPMHELLVQAQKLNSTMQHVICEFEATRKLVEELRMNNSLINEETVKKVEEMKNITLNKVVHDKFSYLQDQIEATKQQIGVFKDNLSILGSKCEENNMVAETMAETTMKELDRKYGLLMSKMEALESHVSDLNSSQYVQKVDNDATQHTESIEYTAENDEWMLSEITDLNQQVSSLVLPQYRMPL